jgi:hypothetical protein
VVSRLQKCLLLAPARCRRLIRHHLQRGWAPARRQRRRRPRLHRRHSPSRRPVRARASRRSLRQKRSRLCFRQRSTMPWRSRSETGWSRLRQKGMMTRHRSLLRKLARVRGSRSRRPRKRSRQCCYQTSMRARSPVRSETNWHRRQRATTSRRRSCLPRMQVPGRRCRTRPRQKCSADHRKATAVVVGYRRGCFRRRRLRQTSFKSSDSGGLFLRYACAARTPISAGVAYSNNL